MNLCNTYLFPAGHLWVVCSFKGPDGSVAMVNFTTWRAGCDESCIVAKGEHPFVVHQTVVAYQFAQLATPDKQAGILKNPGTYQPHKPVSNELLLRLLRGGLASDMTPQKVQAVFLATIKMMGLQP